MRSMPSPRRSMVLAAAVSIGGATLSAASSTVALAQTFPSRPITLVVGLAAGSGQDAAARTISRRAGELLGAAIVVDNRPGGGTITASLSVAKAPPDGYTLLQNGVALSVNPSLYKLVPYDVAQDFVPVAFLVNAPMILVINPSRAAATLALKGLGFVPRTMTPEEFTAFLHDDMKKWPAIAAAAGLSAE